MDNTERLVLNAAQEICGMDRNLTRRIVELYDSAPGTFRKYKPKMSQFIIVTKDVDTFIKVACVLKEAKKQNGLAHAHLNEFYADVFSKILKVPFGRVPEVLTSGEVDNAKLARYQAFNEYMGLLFGAIGAETLAGKEKEDADVLMAMHEEPYFEDVMRELRTLLVNRPGAFAESSFIDNCKVIHGESSVSQMNGRRVRVPLHEVTTGKIGFDPMEASAYTGKKSFICNMAGLEVQNLILEWNIMGLNGYQAVYDNPLTVKELKSLVELAYWRMKPFELDYHRAEDLFMVVSYVVSLYREKTFQKLYKEMFNTVQKGVRPKEHTVTDAFSGKLDEVTAENENLKKKLLVAEKNIAALRGSLKEANRQIYDLNARLPEPEPEETVVISEPVMEELPAGETEEERFARFREYIKTHRVLVWGCRDSHIRKMEREFPELTLMGNRALTAGQLENYDFVVIRLDNTSHSTYYKVRATVDRSELPKCVMTKGENSPAHLVNKVLTAIDGESE